MKKSNNSLTCNDLVNIAYASSIARTDDPRKLANALTARDQSKKFDGGKIRMELIPTSALTSIGRVLTHGAEKYGPNTWQTVEYERYVGALIRHLVSFIDDPTGVDSDSGLKHTEHLLANAVFLNDCVAAGRIPTNERP